MPTDTLEILLVRFSSMGDLILTTPLLRAIRVRHPTARLTFVVREDMADTLRGNPRIDRLVAWPRGASLRALGRQLRAEPWTHRLDLHGSLRSRLLRHWVGGEWTGYPKHRWRRWQLVRSHRRRGGALDHVAERYFAAARDLDVRPDGGPPEFYIPPATQAAADLFLAERGVGARPVIALAPGAAHATKRWPADHWLAVARALHDRYDLVVLGGPGEREIGAAIAAAGGNAATSAAGHFALAGTAALLRRAKALVAGDTGVLHLATAVGTPLVGLYGPTVREFGFFPYHGRATILERDLGCRPCSSRGGPVCPLGHHHCLVQILPADVARAIAELPT